MSYESFTLLTLGLYLALTAILLYQSWMNLAKKQFTKYSWDALWLISIRARRGKKALSDVKKLFTQEPNRMRVFGLVSFLQGCVSFYLAIEWYMEHFR